MTKFLKPDELCGKVPNSIWPFHNKEVKLLKCVKHKPQSVRQLLGYECPQKTMHKSVNKSTIIINSVEIFNNSKTIIIT